MSNTNYYRIEELIQYSDASGVVTNLWRQPLPNQPVGDRFLQLLLAENLIAADTIVITPCLHLTSVEQRRAQETYGNLRRPAFFYVQMLERRLSVGKRQMQQGYGASIFVLVGSESEQAASIVNRIGNVQILPRGKLRALADLMVAADKARSLKFLRRLTCQVSLYLNLPGTDA